MDDKHIDSYIFTKATPVYFQNNQDTLQLAKISQLHSCPTINISISAEMAENPFQMDEDIRPLETTEIAPLERREFAYPSPSEGSKNLRSRVGLIKQEEATGTTTEEDEIEFEEDLDDKFDRKSAAKWGESNLESEGLAPPENFAPVINQIYRSSFPQPQNFSFLKKLGLKSVLCLIPEEYPESHCLFFKKEGIQLFQLGMSGNKEPFVEISSELISEAIKIVIDPANHPILIHCNRGKHRTGCLVGVLRRLQGWSLTIIFDEYRKFAAPKERPMDQQFIELYDEEDIVDYATKNGYLPMTWG